MNEEKRYGFTVKFTPVIYAENRDEALDKLYEKFNLENEDASAELISINDLLL